MSDDLFDIFNEEPAAPVPSLDPSHAETASTDAKQADSSGATPLPLTAVDATGTHGSLSTKQGGAPADDIVALQDDNCLGGASFPSATRTLSPVLPRPSQYEANPTAQVPMAPPLPLPILPSTNALPVRSGGGAVMIIRSAPASHTRSGEDAGDAATGTTPRTAPPASAVFTESHSHIRLRRATVAFEQLTVRLAEFPYASFAQFRQAAARSAAQAPVPHTCVGVVTRKSDPKQKTAQARASRYAVFTLWNMESISPSPETEVSFLLCGDAFELLYSQLVRGSVVALSNVAMCSRKGDSGNNNSGSNRNGTKANLEVLLRVADHTTVRQLGFAADLGTCESVSTKSNERCHAVVNTRLSQHCSYHVGDLRKVARGTAGHQTTPSHAAPSAASIAVMKGGALTSHMKLASPTSTRRVGASLRPTPGPAPSLVTSSSVQPPAPHVNARLAASQQLLRQPSFFAVRGATGLPVDDAAQRRGLASAGTGVYGGVQRGAPLPLTQKVGLRPTQRYPSAQELGVTSRGRDVLEAARQQAVLSEEEKLLRRSLQSGALKTSSDALHGSLTSSLKKSNGSGGTAQGTATTTTTTTTASRVRERDSNVPSASTNGEGVQANKRTRPDATPTSSAASSAHTTATTTTTATTSTGADAARVEALRAQFQPLHRSTPTAFAALSGHSGVHSVIASAVERDYRHSVVLSGSSGGHNAQTALLRAAAKAAKEMSKTQSRKDTTASTDGSGAPLLNHSAGEPLKKASEEALPLTLLGTVASGVQSEHDHLRGEADKQRLLSFVDKQITKEKALEALEAITQQEIKAYYCYGCRCWYAKPPTTCVEQHHRTELKPALKKYIKCEHCNYKTFVIGGEDAKGWKVFPRCPRCHEASFWVRGDAAPQIAGPVEEPTPF